jgi:tetratricopeptide (TPR) repeat protein
VTPEPAPTVTPTDPSVAKPAPAPIDPLRQNLIRGKEARKRGKSDEAIAAYRAALRIDPANRTALRELSRLYFDGGNYDNAAKYGKQLVAASNASASDRVALGDAYFKLGRTADAKAQYQKAAALGDATAKKRLAKLGG